MSGRRLMCFFDGTSNRAVGALDVEPTNVFRLNQAFTYGFSGVPQITFYFSGVGTRGDTMSMATGKGFDQIVMEAFINLASNYMNGDSIYLFGFSRGAAAARAISGLISDPGLLHADGLEVFPELWRYYVDATLNSSERRNIKKKLKGRLLDPKPTVEFLGLFDTVAGTSWDIGSFFSKIRFPNSVLDASVKNAVHILSIDDDRNPSFAPLTWTAKDDDAQFLEQIWMPGVHSDVGGASEGTFLADVALITMIERIAQRCPELEWDDQFIRAITDELKSSRKLEITYERPGLGRKLLWRGNRQIRPTANQYIHPIFPLLKGRRLLIRGTKRVYEPDAYEGGLTEAKLSTYNMDIIQTACRRALA